MQTKRLCYVHYTYNAHTSAIRRQHYTRCVRPLFRGFGVQNRRWWPAMTYWRLYGYSKEIIIPFSSIAADEIGTSRGPRRRPSPDIRLDYSGMGAAAERKPVAARYNIFYFEEQYNNTMLSFQYNMVSATLSIRVHDHRP